MTPVEPEHRSLRIVSLLLPSGERHMQHIHHMLVAAMLAAILMIGVAGGMLALII